jgi:DNA-binding CsgD family transcriptional regulator
LSNALRAAADRGPFVVLFEPREVPRTILEHHDFFSRDHGPVREKLVAAGIMARTNLSKNVKLTLKDHAGVSRLRFFDETRSAVEWCRQMVKEHLGGKLAHRAVLAEFERVLATPTVPPIYATPARTADELPILLEAFREPAFLVDFDGEITFRNAAARRSDLDDAWIRSVVANDPESQRECARVMRLQGSDLYLVVPVQPWELPEAFSSVCDTWPPRLRQTVELLLEGLSDREIAERLSTQPSTARTYVMRVFRRLGVRSRKELLPLFARFGVRGEAPSAVRR